MILVYTIYTRATKHVIISHNISLVISTYNEYVANNSIKYHNDIITKNYDIIMIQ